VGYAQSPAMPLFNIGLQGNPMAGGDTSVVLEIFLLLTVLSLAPAILVMLTSFTRIVMVLSLLRQAMGTNQMPPNQILASLAIFMTVVIMYHVGNQINDEALQPYMREEISLKDAAKKAEVPLRVFLFKHTREKDLSIFYTITKMERPENRDQVPTVMLAAAYMISELKTGFTIGFLIYIPFLVLDMVVSSILLAMGMMMLPPAMVSMPFKLLLFILVDGWTLLTGSLVNSFAL